MRKHCAFLDDIPKYGPYYQKMGTCAIEELSLNFCFVAFGAECQINYINVIERIDIGTLSAFVVRSYSIEFVTNM